jgi:ABC-type transport system involved in cytochrome c biogenesis permease component
MEQVKIKLSALWVALMLTYLLGDVLRIFSGDFVAGEVEGMQITQAMYLLDVRSNLDIKDEIWYPHRYESQDCSW